jgi:hypothetical protein
MREQMNEEHNEITSEKIMEKNFVNITMKSMTFVNVKDKFLVKLNITMFKHDCVMLTMVATILL